MFFRMSMDQDVVKVHKQAKKERDQYPAILTEQALVSKKDLNENLNGDVIIAVLRTSMEKEN